MATLEDSFSRDLEDTSDDSGAEEDDRDAAILEKNEIHLLPHSKADGREEVGTARLQSSKRYNTIMEVGHGPESPKLLLFWPCGSHSLTD